VTQVILRLIKERSWNQPVPNHESKVSPE